MSISWFSVSVWLFTKEDMLAGGILMGLSAITCGTIYGSIFLNRRRQRTNGTHTIAEVLPVRQESQEDGEITVRIVSKQGECSHRDLHQESAIPPGENNEKVTL